MYDLRMPWIVSLFRAHTENSDGQNFSAYANGFFITLFVLHFISTHRGCWRTYDTVHIQMTMYEAMRVWVSVCAMNSPQMLDERFSQYIWIPNRKCKCRQQNTMKAKAQAKEVLDGVVVRIYKLLVLWIVLCARIQTYNEQWVCRCLFANMLCWDGDFKTRKDTYLLPPNDTIAHPRCGTCGECEYTEQWFDLFNPHPPAQSLYSCG